MTLKNKLDSDRVIAQVAQLAEAADSKSACYEFDSRLAHQSYAYLLGQFLGDGNLSPVVFGSGKLGFRMRIYQDSKYPNIIKRTKDSIHILFKNKIQIQNKGNYVEIGFYNSNLDKYFPLIKGGKAYMSFELLPWQKQIITNFPEYFIKGCVHSDGCIYKDRGYTYYSFSNLNEKIKDYYCMCCDILNIKYTRKIGQKIVFHRTKEAVKKLQLLIGDKS